jgi:hypothetical protein
MRLLIVDLLRRGRWRTVAFSVLLVVTVWASAAAGDIALAYAVSTAFVFNLGPRFTLRFVARPIWYLPVSSRDVWRSGWLVATFGVTAMTTAAKLLAVIVMPASPGVASVALSALYDFGATGIGAALVIVSTGGAARLRVPLTIRGIADVVWPIAPMVPIFAPQMFGWRLPVHYTEISSRGVTILAAILALTVATYFHTPVHPERAHRQTLSAHRRGEAAMSHSSRLKGLPYLLLREYGLWMLFGVGMAASLGLVIVLLSRLAESPGAVADLVRAELLLLDGAGAPAFESAEFLALMLWGGLFFASVSARFPSLMRHLRVLPIGGARLNAMLVAWPALIWLTVWLLVVALRYLVIGRGATWLSVALAVVMTGLSALVQALMLRLPMLRTLVLPAAFLAVLLVRVFIAPSSVELALLGVAALAAAAIINRTAFRRSATYRIRPTVFGVPIPPTSL